jgi:hypothetical protein
MMVDLGGPGTPCSATRVRRLVAGELHGAVRDRTQEHVDGCARCQSVLREIGEERSRLVREVPFDSFAAGVAEKLARSQQQPRFTRWVPLAAAAALLLVVSVSLGVRQQTDNAVRTKGGASVAVFQREGTQVRAVSRSVGSGPIMVRLEPSGHAYAAVILIEPQESALLYAGPARSELPQAFEWTGTARRATLLAVFADKPIDGEAVRRDGAKAAPKGAEVVRVPLERAP